MEISEIKAHLTITTVLSHYNLTPDRNHRLNCPWHNDKTPSLQIYPKTNTWTCFSTNCNAGSGDVIDFIMKYERVTKHEALTKATAMVAPIGTTEIKSQLRPKVNPIELIGQATPNELVGQAILTKYFQGSIHGMARSYKAQEYAKQRELDYNKLNIGFCGYGVGKTWNKDLQDSARKLGLFSIKSCLIFPMKNKQGQIVSIYGRSINKNPKAKHFYLAKDEGGTTGGHQGYYPKYPSRETIQLILTESIIDAASVQQELIDISINKDRAVLALYGTNGFTDDHEQTIKELDKLEEVILFFDGDEAGRKAVQKYALRLAELRPELKVSYVKTLEDEDPNSLIQSHDREILNHLMESRLLFSIESSIESTSNEGHASGRTGSIEIKSTSDQTKYTTTIPLTKSQSTKGVLNTDNPELLNYSTAEINILIMGGIKITGLDKLKVTLKITRSTSSGQADHLHVMPLRYTLDLYHSKQTEQLIQKITEKIEISTTAAEASINHMTSALEDYRQTKLELLKPKKDEGYVMTEAERSKAMKYLKNPKLLRNTLVDISRAGLIGERNNALIAYLAYTSRKREKPLHIMCLGASGTGKTYLQEKVSQLIPEEDKLEITSLSDNAFYYFGRKELKHKLILIEDLDGAQNAEYPLREIQTKRRISKTVTIKDNKGMLKTINVVVEGPVSVSGCTTRERLYEDNANRCILLYIDDSVEQDKRIMAYQQKVSAGAINSKEEGEITNHLQNVQRLLRPIKIINPYAELIDLPQSVFKPRRTLLLLLSFIETITYYHQYQRSVRTDSQLNTRYIESTPEDITAAFSLMKEVLFSKSDELSKACRKFLERLKESVQDGQVFYTSEIRKQMRISSSTVHRYIWELKRNGYIKYKGGNKYRGYEYEIVDYEEYEKLKSSIDQQLEDILLKINGSSVPVSHEYPTDKNGIMEPLKINELA